MKLQETYTPPTRPFFRDENLTILTERDKNKHITGFTVTCKGEKKTFPVRNNKVLAAWKQVENFTKNL